MSETNKLRALLMAAVMVMSVFAGAGAVSAQEDTTTETTTDAPTDTTTETNTTTDTETNTDTETEPNTDASTDVTADSVNDPNPTTITGGEVVFQGEELNVDVNATNSLGEDVTLREVTGSGDSEDTSFVRQLDVDEDGYVDIDTEDLEGRYRVTNGGDTDADQVNFEVAVQTLQANWSEDSVTQGDNETLELQSNRNGYLVNVSADGLDADELESIFNGSGEVVNVDQDEDRVTIDTSETEDLEANFTNVDAGNYDFNVDVTDTTASDTASIEVTESDADVNFAQSVYSEQVGDKVEISVEMEDSNEAYVFVGGEDVNYLESVHLVDDDEDGAVNFTFNTYLAGQGNDTSTDAFEVQGDDELGDDGVTRFNNSDNDNIPDELSDPLEPGDYDLRAASSNDYGGNNDEVEDEQDVATLDLTQRNTSDINTLTAPRGSAGEYDDTEELLQNVNQSDTLALGDRLVVQVNASGMSGIINEDSDISALEESGVNLSLEEADSGANSDAASFDLTDSNAEIYSDQSVAEDQFFVVIDTRNSDFFEDGEEYNAVFTLGDEDSSTSPIPYVNDDEEESVETSFTAETAEATLDLNDDDQFEVPQSQNAQVQFDTNLAGGSEVTVRMRSSASNSAFLLSNTVETNGDGSVNTTFDTSNIDTDTEFDVTVRAGSETLADEDGIIVEGQNMTGTDSTVSETPGTDDGQTPVSETETDAPGETPTEDGSATPGEETETGSTDGSTPGFGVVVAVTALLAAALLAVRRD